MPRTRVKICGITRTKDANAVVAYGADALGLVFYAGSPRYVTIEQARLIAGSVAPLVTVVGLFVDSSPAVVRGVLDTIPLGLLQFHGAETNAHCKQFGLPFIKSIAVRDGVDVLSCMQGYPDASGFILDAWQPQAHGGGGEIFDWGQVPDHAPAPVILAGGLTPGNVAQAIRTTRPYAVDVSSGVESAKGIKSTEKIAAFMKGVAHSDTGG
jgi:phosphoribosylanthranilate isomerase